MQKQLKVGQTVRFTGKIIQELNESGSEDLFLLEVNGGTHYLRRSQLSHAEIIEEPVTISKEAVEYLKTWLDVLPMTSWTIDVLKDKLDSMTEK